MRTLFSIVLFLILTLAIYAKPFSIADIDTSKFPEITATLHFGVCGNYTDNLTNDDYRVTENNVPCEVIGLECKKFPIFPTLSYIIVLDASSSMDTSETNLIKMAGRAWIDKLTLVNSDCAITSFNNYNYLLQDFTKDKRKLKQGINKLFCTGSTCISAALGEEKYGALVLAERKQRNCKIIVITDGKDINYYGLSYGKQLSDLNGELYFFVIRNKADQKLVDMAEKSGGRVYESLQDYDDVLNALDNLLPYISYRTECKITWKSNYRCKSTMIETEIAIQEYFDNFNYQTSDMMIGEIEVVPEQFDLGQIEPHKRFDTTFTIRNDYYDLIKVEIQNTSAYSYIYPTSRYIYKGESAIFNLSAAPMDDGYYQDAITISYDNCSKTMTATYGTPGVEGKPDHDKKPTVAFPNGGEKLVAGSDTMLKWQGIYLDDPVNIRVSTNNGTTWDYMENNKKGLNFEWQVPVLESDNCIFAIDNPFQTSGLASTLSWSKSGYSNQELKTGYYKNYIALYTDDYIEILTSKSGDRAAILNTESGVRTKHVAVSNNGNILATINDDGKFQTWNLQFDSPQIISEITLADNDYQLYFANKDSRLFLVHDNMVTKYNAANLNDKQDIITIGQPITNLEWSPSDSYIAGTDTDKNLYVWRGYDFSLVSSIIMPGPAQDICFFPNSLVFCVAFNGLLQFYNSKSLSKSHSISIATNDEVKIDYMNQYTLGCCGKNNFKIFDQTGKELLNIPTYNAEFVDLISLDGLDRIALLDKSGTVTILSIIPGPTNYDMSDDVWSIVFPEISSMDIDLGKMSYGNIKDSVVSAYLTNSGKYHCTIKNITITGADKGEFWLGEDFDTVTLAPGQTKDIAFRFKPLDYGECSALVHVITQAGPRTYNIKGEGIPITFKQLNDSIHFGSVKVTRDSTISKYVIENFSSEPHKITSIEIKGDQFDTFCIIGRKTNIELASKEKYLLELNYKPQSNNVSNADIYIHYDYPDSPIIVSAKGRGIGSDIMVPQLSGAAGQRINIPFIIEDFDSSFFAREKVKYEGIYSFDKTMLAPLEKSNLIGMDDSLTYISFSGYVDPTQKRQFGPDCIVGLGPRLFSKIALTSLEFYHADNTAIDFIHNRWDGYLFLNNYCEDGGPQLINPNSTIEFKTIAPNPARGLINFEFVLSETGITELVITNTLGQIVKRINIEPKQGLNSLSVDTSDLSAGNYLLQLRTPTMSKVQTLVILP